MLRHWRAALDDARSRADFYCGLSSLCAIIIVILLPSLYLTFRVARVAVMAMDLYADDLRTLKAESEKACGTVVKL